MTDGIRMTLRAEGLVLALGTIAFLWHLGPSWWLVVIILIAPDLAIAAYLWGPRIGALCYNMAHSYVGPLLLLGLGVTTGSAVIEIGAIWLLHCAADRALGYGLKYSTSFQDTHLDRIGRD